MAAWSSEPITELLQRWSEGDREAAERVLPELYDELRRVAAAYLQREGPGHTLQPTALIHEAYLRLEQGRSPHWRSRTHFLAIAARLMRQILVDHARGRDRLKRGGGEATLPLLEAQGLAVETPVGLLALDDALKRLAAESAEAATVVELRFFSGLTVEETARHLGLSSRTVDRQWRRARAWLYRELTREEGPR